MEFNTSLSKNGYSILKEDFSSNYLNDLRKELTVKAFINKNYLSDSNPFPVYCESKRKLYLPKFYGIEKFGLPKTNKISEGEDVELEFSSSLKEKQKPISKAYIDAAKKIGGGIIAIPCGYGKTVIALYIASVLKKKTLVVVHKEFLLNQWKERISQFLPDAKIGKIQGNVIKIENYEIVIGMLQSISMREYPDNTFNSFGLVIYDECHHLGAEVFSRALLKTQTKYCLGLSATPKRLDGLSKVFEWHLGPICFSIKKRTLEKVDVKSILYYDDDQNYSKEILNYMNKPNSAKMINNICLFFKRTQLLLQCLFECLEEGRKILILSDRREHLKILKTELEKNTNYTYGYYLGGMKEKDLQETEKKDVILGTFTMASEGFDCKYPLNTIILASPKSNIEQAVGRILRQEESKRTKVPLIIDIKDNFSIFVNQSKKREKLYTKNKYNIVKYSHINGVYEQLESSIKKSNKNACDFDFLD